MNITGGKYKGRKILSPDEKITRPTLSKTRESIFNMLFSITDFEGKSFLDMYAGSGIMGLEALSSVFEKVYCIEKNIKVAKVLKSNYEQLELKPNLIIGDSIKSAHKFEEQFDVIYIDPPYQSGLYEDSLKTIKQHNLLKKDGVVLVEHPENINFENFKIYKQKTYSQKFITILVE